jgi:hypothetical protein
MSTLTIRNIQTSDGSPVNFPHGIRIGSATGAGDINNIGTPGQQGFGVGIAPELPTGFAKLYGTEDPASDVYGNYQYSDGSVMVYIPAFFYKYGTGTNGLALNVVDVKPFGAYESVAAANAAGYALHRAFYNGGAIRPGVFVDKYLCSNNGGIASSIKNGNPLSSNASHNPFSGLTGAPSNTYAGAIAAAKTRGSSFFCNSLFINKALALLANAHGSASTGTAYNAWYTSGSTNFPKGCNNNALGDVNDATLSFVSDGYSNAAKTGSANFLAKTAHNGQNCGVVDLNGCMWEVSPGLTMDSSDPAVGKFYVLKTTADMAAVTGSNTLATDLWGASGLAALYDDLGVMNSFTGYAVNFSDRVLNMGSASQVLSAATTGTAWKMAGAGVPLAAGGSNQFGSDYLYDYSTADMCPRCGGGWDNSSGAGVWALYWGDSRTASGGYVGFRSALYL